MTFADAEEFTQSLGQIVAGSWRQIELAHRLGVPKALGFPTTRSWVEDRLGGYVKLSITERIDATKELIKTKKLSQREAADILGVGVATVNRDLAGDVPNGTTTTEDTEENQSPHAPNGTPAPCSIDSETGESLDATADADVSDPKGHHLARNTGNNEWYTPAEDIERARKVLGAIDLDPASSAVAQKVVRAVKFFTREDDGLAQEWSGRVWLNPPYAKGGIEPFVAKLVAEYRAGNVTSAIMLTNNSGDTEWFHKAAAHASAICLTRGRIKFEDPNSDRAAPLQGQAFFYFGASARRFASLYAPAGIVLLPYRDDPAASTAPEQPTTSPEV
jgi:ParB family chromosome partitioning protein